MANICDTSLSVQATDKTKDFANKIDKMVKWLQENYMYDDYGSDTQADDEFFEIVCGTRWNVEPEKLQEFCKKFRVRVRAWGVEPAIGFVQVVHIEDDGSIISDEEIGFKF